MKKTIFIFITLFIFVSNSKALSKFSLGEKIPDMHIETVIDGKKYNAIPHLLIRDDGEFVYSLNLQQTINTIDYYNEYNYNNTLFNLTDEQLNKINLIAYYGYGYENHTDIKWYGITQFLIWKILYNDICFIDVKNGNKIYSYEEEIKELENLVNGHYLLPNFANHSFEMPVNSEQHIFDSNYVFKYYDIKSSTINSYIKNNKVCIESKEKGDYEIVFIRKSPVEKSYLLYELENSQSLIYPGKIDNVEFKVNINVSSGSITINKNDSENINRQFAKLDSAEYGVYLDDKLITTIKTNKEGVAKIDNLSWGRTYTIKELSTSVGYKIDENIYKVVPNRLNKDVVIEAYSEVIKGNVIINKCLGKSKNCELEDGAVFEIYDINNNLIGVYKTEKGIIEIELDYGEYYVIQKSGTKGYNLVDKFNISIKEEKDYIVDLYSEKQEEIFVVEVPNTQKYDLHKFIPIILILIGIGFIFKSKKATL